MATVSALTDHVKRVASLGSYDGTDEETLIVDWLNDGYRFACRECDTPVEIVSAALTSGDNQYTLTDLSMTNVLRFKNLYVTGGSPDPWPLTEIDHTRMLELQATDGAASQDKPHYFTLDGLDLITLWPTPGTGLTLTAKAVVDPPVLVSSGPSAGEETTPSKIPASYHYSVLAAHAIMRGYEYRGGDPVRANEYRNRRDLGIAQLREQRNTAGGDIPAAVRVVRGRVTDQAWPGRQW